jgi:hypothetical protein
MNVGLARMGGWGWGDECKGNEAVEMKGMGVEGTIRKMKNRMQICWSRYNDGSFFILQMQSRIQQLLEMYHNGRDAGEILRV